MDLIAFA